MYVENLRTAKATDHFILAGKGEEEFEPTFTYHGFRYAEVSGVAGKPRRRMCRRWCFIRMRRLRPS